jgi:hypothetical protein
MDLATLLPHLDLDTKNLLIGDLTVKDIALASESLNVITEDYLVENIFSLMNYFSSRFIDEIENEEHSQVLMKEKIENLLITKMKNLLKEDKKNSLILTTLIKENFSAFSENTFNHLIELTESFPKEEKLTWLGLITEKSESLVKMSAKITSPKAQKIITQHMDSLTHVSVRNLFANTDLVAWYSISKDFIEQYENTEGYNNYVGCEHHPICFRMATLTDLMINQVDINHKHTILDIMLKQSSVKDCKVIKKEFEEFDFLLNITQDNLFNVELTQQYFPFSQIKCMSYYGIDIDDLVNNYCETGPLLSFLVSDQKFSLGKSQIFDEGDFLHNFDSLTSYVFENKDSVVNLLKLSFIAKKNMNERELLMGFIQWIIEKKDDILTTANFYENTNENWVNKYLNIIEKYIIERTITTDEVKTGKKVKI